MKAFISYRRSDTAGYAGRLYDHLCRHFGKDEIFADFRSLSPSEQYSYEILNRASGCRVMFVLIGPQWLVGQRLLDPGDWVHREVLTGIERKGLWVVPVTVNEAELPTEDKLPSPLRPLASYQGVKLTDHTFARDVDQLIDALVADKKIERSPWSWIGRLDHSMGGRLAAFAVGGCVLLGAGAMATVLHDVLTDRAAPTSVLADGEQAVKNWVQCPEETLNLKGYLIDNRGHGVNAAVFVEKEEGGPKELGRAATDTKGQFHLDISDKASIVRRKTSLRLRWEGQRIEPGSLLFSCGEFVPPMITVTVVAQ